MKSNIVTHGVKYIGSKKALLPYIGEAIDGLQVSRAIDVFSGTTRVAQYLKQLGIQTDTSDLSWATTAYAKTFVHRPKDNTENINQYLSWMTKLEGHPGWLSENYTGDFLSDEEKGDGRCFQLKNAMKADRLRDEVEKFLGKQKDSEFYCLVTSIIMALDAVDNTVGVQQAYLKTWCKRSYNEISFKPPPFVPGPTGIHYEGSCLDIEYREADLAYIDPPYSPHSYATYYHIWDSVARWDKPQTALKARRRVDRVSGAPENDDSMASPWNSRKTALTAFDALLSRLPTKHCLISYSDESLVSREDLLDLASQHGKTTVMEVDYRRNIMSQIGNAKKNVEPETGQKNKELLILVSR